MKSFHQAVHSADTDVNAIITLENESNFISTKSFPVISIELKNGPADALILFGAVSRFRTEMLVVGASVDT